MKTGIYTVTEKETSEGKVWRHRYIVYKVMLKTAEVKTQTSLNYEEFKDDNIDTFRCMRYPIDLLMAQTANAEHFDFLD